MVWRVGAGPLGVVGAHSGERPREGEWGCANLGRMAGLLLLPQPR